MHIKRFYYYFLFNALIIAGLVWFNISAQDTTSSIFTHIAQEYKKTIETIPDDQGIWSMNQDIQTKGIKQYCEDILQQQEHPNPDRQQQKIYDILSNYEITHPCHNSSILDYSTWQDLEILCGPKSNPSCSLASHLDRTKTHIGKAILHQKLVSPETDIEKLTQQQKALAFLISHQDIKKRLNYELKIIAENENLTLSFWDPEDLFVNVYLQNKVRVPFAEQGKYIKAIENILNTSPLFLQLRSSLSQNFDLLSNMYILYLFFALTVYGVTGKDIKEKIPPKIAHFLPDAQKLQHLSIFSLTGTLMFLTKNLHQTEDSKRMASCSMVMTKYAENLYWALEDIVNGDFFTQLLYTKTQQVAQYLTHTINIATIVKQHEQLNQYCHHTQALTTLLEKMQEINKSFYKLIKIMRSSTFNGSFNKYTSYFGRMLVAFGMILEHRDDLVNIMFSVGEIDTLLSTIKLYDEKKETTTPYSLPTFLDPYHAEPTLSLIDVWHPGIAQEKVVSNSIALGNLYNTPQNAIITGPNAGGKSTITKSFILATLIAQTLGIAPAQNITLTPFAKIITYLNITDDIAAGNSHFKAGVLRARTLTETIAALPPHHYMLSAVDEIFNGTTFKEGQAAAYSFIKTLGEQPHGICITNTHFPLIPMLEEKEKTFLNYKVSVIENANQPITYPFKLERGISKQIITFKILEEEGFNDAFLTQANAILNNT